MATQKTKNSKDKPRDGKKKPYQDDTFLIVVVALILIVAQAYVFKGMQSLSTPQKTIIKVDSDDVARAVNQDLAAQRHSIEDHLKNFLYVPGNPGGSASMSERRAFFNEASWQSYQSYLGMMQRSLSPQNSVRGEFVFGRQKYAVLENGETAFRAEGLFCLGGDADYQCGPQGFILEALMSGDIMQPEHLRIENWRIMPPVTAAQ